MSCILIVDDEESIRRSLAGLLADEGYQTEAAADGERALALLRGRAEAIQAVLLDIAMPGRNGVDILEAIRARWPELPVVMMSGHGTIEIAVRATQLGAVDFIEKPLSADKLLLTLERALERARLRRESRRRLAQALGARSILGVSAPIRRLREQLEKAAPTQGWVLITGDNGTGKELVARQIHIRSRRAQQPFVEVNCAAIPEALIESELFGHERGAFTGALARKRGRFELADGGTIFLDEIADMSLQTQAKVLRALQQHTFERVGGTETVRVDVRVIAATNKNLEEEIEAGNFREDLYYRLAVIPLHVPPLRKRREDIPVLSEIFVKEFCAESGVVAKRLSSRARAVLEAYAWPGNVRELRNLMERLVLMTPGTQVDADDLPDVLHARPARHTEPDQSLERARKSFEREFLIARLREHRWNISRTADAVGLARESLSRKIRSLGIDVDRA